MLVLALMPWLRKYRVNGCTTEVESEVLEEEIMFDYEKEGGAGTVDVAKEGVIAASDDESC